MRSVDEMSLGEGVSGEHGRGDVCAAGPAAGTGVGSGVGAGTDRAVGGVVADGIDRVEAAAGAALDLGRDLDRDAGRVEEVAGGMLGARMFAHEVNNLVTAIAGRAQRGLVTGEDEHVRAALELAADVGGRVAGLCALFLESTGEGESRQVVLDRSQLVGVHEFAAVCVAGHPVLVGGERGWGGVDFVCDLGGVDEGNQGQMEWGEWGEWGVGMPGMLLGQVLVNLYGNALTGIGRGLYRDDQGGKTLTPALSLGQREEEGEAEACTPMLSVRAEEEVEEEVGGLGLKAGVVRLRGGWVEGGGVELVVEDSGVGFDDGGVLEDGAVGTSGAGGVGFGGYGLGLGVCRALVGGFGGRLETGRSMDLGGGLVRLVFG
ncbi:MAG: hypothetical protein ACSHX5_08640 [Phycisphaerales bacterium]